MEYEGSPTLARIPDLDTPIYAQLRDEQIAKEAYALFFEEYKPLAYEIGALKAPDGV